MARKPDRYFRFYFVVKISCLIPKYPYAKGSSGDNWESDFLSEVTSDIASKLPTDGYDVAYKGHRAIAREHRLYEAEFAVAKLEKVKEAKPLAARKGRIKAELKAEIEAALRDDYVIKAVAFEYAACRDFVWEIYLSGMLQIRYTITDQDIADAEGSVRTAIENLYEKVSDELRDVCDVHTYPPSRRPKSGIWDFELTATRYFCFKEDEVIGNVAALSKDTEDPQNYELGIDCDDAALTRVCDDEKDAIQLTHIDMLSVDFEIVYFHLDFVDYEDDVMEIIDETVFG